MVKECFQGKNMCCERAKFTLAELLKTLYDLIQGERAKFPHSVKGRGPAMGFLQAFWQQKASQTN